ncbi:MAG: hypothetical protein HY704_15880 [Gemmatimonadetes bacterium]|nr:hypothetical protein [Gemmatimonadota bacterium]
MSKGSGTPTSGIKGIRDGQGRAREAPGRRYARALVDVQGRAAAPEHFLPPVGASPEYEGTPGLARGPGRRGRGLLVVSSECSQRPAPLWTPAERRGYNGPVDDAELRAHFERIDARFQQIDARFEQIDARFDRMMAAIAGHFEAMDGRFARLETRMDRLEQRVDAMHVEFTERFLSVDERFRTLELRIEQFEARVTSALDGLREETALLSQRVDVLGNRVAALENRVEKVEDGLLVLSGRVDVLADDMR